MARSKVTESKLRRIREIISLIRKEETELKDFCQDSNSEVRYDAIEALQIVMSPERSALFYKALSDPDELVRSSALEGIGSLNCKVNFEEIAGSLEDDSILVRSAAAICLADLGAKEMICRIQAKLNDASDEEKVSYFFALCILGKKEFFSRFVNLLFHDFYRIRCAVANLVGNLVCEENVALVTNLLTIQLAREKTRAAKSSITRALEDIGVTPPNGNLRTLRNS